MVEPRIRRSEIPDITMHAVQNQDLDLIRKDGNQATGGAAGVSLCASTLTAVIITLATCEVSESWRTLLASLVPLSIVGAAACGRMWWRGQREGARRVNEIKDRPIAEPSTVGTDEKLEAFWRGFLEGRNR